MKKTRELLLEDYNKVNDMISNSNIKEEGYNDLLKERDNIRNELVKLDSVEIGKEIENDKINADNKREKTKNIITIGSIIVSAGIGIWTVIKTFRFDEDSTITSTLGRSAINNAVSKLFKR